MEKKVFNIFNFRKNKSENTANNVNDFSELTSTCGISSTSGTLDELSDCNNTFTLDLGDLNSGPMRPILKAYPKTQFGLQKRAFSSAYYQNHDWLEYSLEKDAIFCYACRLFSNSSGHNEETFTTLGFKNWKKASRLFLPIYKMNC
ncbi:unnamed protein product [Macrosiphum euphorbiae]|uniref:TTF-type domain-containing protein n=1 Tax=Macrosiphum euphorbiae TaxID=13131 RepID=A0AAV0Y9K8_9HEMI|nr:unnamed protein product [Macrosiphum euphorbiae]